MEWNLRYFLFVSFLFRDMDFFGPEDNEFLKAAADGDVEKVKRLLEERKYLLVGEHTHTVNEKSTGSTSATALICASFYGHFPVVELLVTYAADVNLQDDGGNTALHWACANRYHEVATFLINNGADLTIMNNEGKTAIECVGESNEIREHLVRVIAEKEWVLHAGH